MMAAEELAEQKPGINRERKRYSYEPQREKG